VALLPDAEGAEFFRRHCAGRAGDQLMLTHGGSPWRKSVQARPMREASARAHITPAINFHALRHTWASHAVMAGIPLMVVAKQLGHADTKMVEKQAPSYITEAIRAGAPKYGITPDTAVRAAEIVAGRDVAERRAYPRASLANTMLLRHRYG
jgi:hypothetical protein